jgi:hypothetical protein
MIMLKQSISKAVMYISAFVLGYAAGHFNLNASSKNAESPIAKTAPSALCPTTSTPPAPTLPPPPTPEITTRASVIVDSGEENLPAALLEVALSDFDDPDEQIQAVLTAESAAFSQASEQLAENTDPLDALLELPPEHQLDYVKTLVESQEDSAIVALNNLILNDNSEIQNAAIEGMLSLLEMRTGHYEMIAQNLEQNSVFLNDEQLAKLESITQVIATTP